MPPISYARRWFPPVIVQHAIWLYLGFTLSCRDIEDLLADRGLDISYEAVRRWAPKFGSAIARRPRQGRARPAGHWHLDEMTARIGGERTYPWRAVDSEGEALDVLVQRRRDKAAALKLMRRLLRKQGFVPAEITTDGLRSYGAAFAKLGLMARHGQGLRRNNRAEVSLQPVRRRERKMQRFKSPVSAQRFDSMHSATINTLPVRRHLISRHTLRSLRAEAVAQWHAATSAARDRPCVGGLCAPAMFRWQSPQRSTNTNR